MKSKARKNSGWLLLCIITVLVLFLTIIGCSPTTAPTTTAPTTTAPTTTAPTTTAPIKIGVLAELSGPFTAYGDMTLKGLQIATDDINKNGGILGRQVELVVRDTKFMVESGLVDQYINEFLTKEHVDFVMGGTADSDAQEAAKVLSTKGVAYFSNGPADPAGTRGDQIFPLHLTSYIDIDQQAFSVFPYLLVNNLVPKQFVIIGPDYQWGWSNAAAAKNAIGQYGGTVLADIRTALPTVKFDNYIAQIQQLAPNGCTIYTTSVADELIAFMKQAYDMGMLKNYKIIVAGAEFPIYHLALEPKNFAGVYAMMMTNDSAPANDKTQLAWSMRFYDYFKGVWPSRLAMDFYMMEYYAAQSINQTNTLDPNVWVNAMKGKVYSGIVDENPKTFQTINGRLTRAVSLYVGKQPEDMVNPFPPGSPPQFDKSYDHWNIAYTYSLDYLKSIVPDQLVLDGTPTGDPRIGVAARDYWEKYAQEHGLTLP